ncbi:MAG TPA: hypothetical protein VMT79_21350 [Candidatus Binatia bacterium]|nr:hypothetical protein [Candidatus Binatia bacterium]
MNLGIVMRGEVLQDKLEEGRVRRRGVATWNTRRRPTRLTPGWTNRLYVACRGVWRGSFLLSGDVYWNPKDPTAPYALIFDPRCWEPIAAAPCPSFRGWRYLEAPPGGAPAAPASAPITAAWTPPSTA